MLHYNGSAWSVVLSPDHRGEEDELLGVVAKSATDVWAVGDFVDRTGSIPVAKSSTLNSNGTSGVTVDGPSGPSGNTILNGAAAVPGTTSQLWAVGFNLAATGGYRAVVLRHGSGRRHGHRLSRQAAATA